MQSHNLTCPLWYNPNISEETLFLPQWYRVGIIYPANLYNREGNLLTLEEVRNTFGTYLNLLDYYRLWLGREKFRNKNGAGFQIRLPDEPIWPDIISLINKSKKGCKDFYNVLTERDTPKDLVHMKAWKNLLQINIELKEWKNIHLACFKTILGNQIICLQYRILHNILGTKVLLYKMKKAENNLCRFCNNMPETITYVFVDCLYFTEILDLLKNWIYQEIGDDKKSILLGFRGHSTITFSINAMTFIVKSYLFKCCKPSFNAESCKPSFNALQLNIKHVLDEQSYLYAITDATARFTKNECLFQT